MPMRLELTRVAPLPPQSSVSAIPPRHHCGNHYTILCGQIPVKIKKDWTNSVFSCETHGRFAQDRKKVFFRRLCWHMVRRKGFEPSRLVGTAAWRQRVCRFTTSASAPIIYYTFFRLSSPFLKKRQRIVATSIIFEISVSGSVFTTVSDLVRIRDMCKARTGSPHSS